MEMNDQFHTPATLSPGEEPLLLTG